MKWRAPIRYRAFYFVLVPLLKAYWRTGFTGRENVPKSGGVIIASNHRSAMDPVIVISGFWRPIHWLARVDLVVTKKIAWFFKAAAVIPVNRESPQQESIDAAVECIRGGGIFGVFPEGTRSRDGNLHKGYTGVARIAAATGVPVIPTAIMNSWKSMPKGAKLPRPAKCHVRFGAPMHFTMLPGEDEKVAFRRFTDQVTQAIAGLSGQTYVDEYNYKKPPLEG
jgi:1-acyl-sn-glycerol-3-phosphate acyltransferase